MATSSSRSDVLSSLLEEGLPADIATAVANFADGVNDIEERVRRLQRTPWADLCRGLSPLESARLHLMVAYTINTIFYMYLKTQGIPANNHPVMEELERVKAYIRKVRNVSKEAEEKADTSKRQISLNATAAQRFIAHALAAPERPSGDAPSAPAPSCGDTKISEKGASSGGAAYKGGAAGKGGAASERGGEYSKAAVERLDRERAGAASRELGSRLERMETEVETATGDAENDALAREINAEILKHAADMGMLGAKRGDESAKEPNEGKGAKRRAPVDAPKAVSKKDKKSARAMGER